MIHVSADRYWPLTICVPLSLAIASFTIALAVAVAQESTGRYGDDVAAKAERILEQAGLKRSGKSILPAATMDVSRNLTGMGRTRRSLKLLQDAWKQTAAQMTLIRQQAEHLNRLHGQLNAQLAKPVLTITENNRLVGAINANVARMKQLEVEEKKLGEKLAADRRALNDAEAQYAETVLALRRDFERARAVLTEAAGSEQVKIALTVLATNYQSPATIEIDAMLGPLERRIKQIEQEVFSESIPLEIENGSLFVNVSIGQRSVRMVVDSGATLISLPATVAAGLGVTVPADAPQIRLVLADGREIPGRAIRLERVRVGQFEAEQVNAAVLDAVAVNAEPLLGMSFLGNFKFEIDTADRSLKLLRIGDE